MARKLKGSGRLRFAMVLIGFLAVATVVIMRRTHGITAARELHTLDSRRAGLVAERLRLDGDIRMAASRARLQPIAEQRLHMRVPSEGQVVYLTRGSREEP